MIRVGVIGYGLSARAFHLPFIAASDLFELVAISSSRVDAVSAAYPGVATYDSAEELMRSADIDLIIIAAPNDVHYTLARKSLERGLHVVLEKPMVTSSVQAASLVELADRRSSMLSVFQNRRWDGDFLTLQRLVADNAVGDVRYFESHFDRFRPHVRERWRETPGTGAGSWWDLGPHLVDQALCLFGMPEGLTARNRTTRDGAQVTDYFHVLLHYAGLDVVLHSSPFVAAPNIRFQLHGTAGSYVKYGYDPQEAQLRGGMSPVDVGYGIESPEHFGTLYRQSTSQRIETEAGCYQRYFQGIADAIQHGTEPPVRAADIVDVTKILELADL
jgi:predicted dehydrogenase